MKRTKVSTSHESDSEMVIHASWILISVIDDQHAFINGHVTRFLGLGLTSLIRVVVIIMPLLQESAAFRGRPEVHSFAGILFDMDGTIVDSTDAIVKHWHKCVIFCGVPLHFSCFHAHNAYLFPQDR